MKFKSIPGLLAICLSMGPLFCLGQTDQVPIPCNLISIAELMVEKNPQIQRQRLELNQAEADRQMAKSAFDFRLVADASYIRSQNNLFNQDARFESVDGVINNNDYLYSTGLQRLFRNGLSLRTHVDYSRVSNNYPFNSFGEGQAPFLANNFTTLNLDLRQPLLRGRGQKNTAANELFRLKMIESQNFNLNFTSANELRFIVRSYWIYLQNFKRLEIYKDNERRAERILNITQELVKADKKAENDLIQIQADLADRQRQTFSARQFFYAAKQNLGREIGLDVSESELLGEPQNPFPTIAASGYQEDIPLDEYLLIARKNRLDLQALYRQKEGLNHLLQQAENNMKPQLDLLASMSYGGTDVGNGINRMVSPLGQLPGRNAQASIGLSFMFPLNNNAAQAGLVQTQTNLSDQEVVIDNQLRNIELNISIALNELHNAARKLEKAEESFKFYERVYADEQVKFQNGLTTLLNLILFQERLTLSQLQFLDSQFEFALAIVNIRHETGTLIDPSTNGIPQDVSAFYEIPRWE